MSNCRKSHPIPIVSDANPQRLAVPPTLHGPLPRRSTRGQATAETNARMAGVVAEPDLFNILILNYTMRCPLACDYCCYSCSPKRNETMDLALALDLVDQAADLGVFRQCGFTGGEPLIFYDDVLAIGERMRTRNLPFSMISACYWASSVAEAERVIGDLASVGMCVFTATHDPSHENWVPTGYVRNAVDAALARGVHVCICSSFYDDTQRLEHIFPEYVGRGDVDYVNRVVLPNVGRTKRKSIGPASYPNAERGDALGTCYKRIYHDVTIFWDGEAYPCCSVYNRSTPGISLGNVYRDSLAAIWDRAEGSLWLRAIKRRGFAGLYETLRRLDPQLAARFPDPAGALGACDLCHQLFGDEELAAGILDAFARVERERIGELLQLVEHTNGHAVRQRLVESALGDVRA